MAGRRPVTFSGVNIEIVPDPEREGRAQWTATDDAGNVIARKGDYASQKAARQAVLRWARNYTGETHQVNERPSEPRYIADARREVARLDRNAEEARAKADAIRKQVKFYDDMAANYTAAADALRAGFEATLS